MTPFKISKIFKNSSKILQDFRAVSYLPDCTVYVNVLYTIYIQNDYKLSNLTASIAELKTCLVGQAEAELQSLLGGKKAGDPRVRASLQKIKTYT